MIVIDKRYHTLAGKDMKEYTKNIPLSARIPVADRDGLISRCEGKASGLVSLFISRRSFLYHSFYEKIHHIPHGLKMKMLPGAAIP